MDAIAGLFDPAADRADIERGWQRMRAVLVSSDDASRCAMVSTAGAGCVVLDHHPDNRGPSLAHDASRGLWLAFSGELFERDELRQDSTGNPGDADNGEAALCLRRFLSEGKDFVGRLNGHFNIVLYDEIERRLSIATDPFGYRPLFLAHSGRRLLFASEMKAIVAALDTTPDVDGIGLLQLFRQGWSLGERTWLEAIRVATAGTWYDFDARGVRSRRYFCFGFQSNRARSLPEYTQEFAARLRRAMCRATSGSQRIGIALSGGLDSRALLLASEPGSQRLAYTFGSDDSRDVMAAVELARLAGVPHLHLGYGTDYLGRCLAPIVWRTDGLLPFSEVTFTSLNFHQRLAERVELLVYGHAGDALTGAHMAHRSLLSRSRDKLIDRAFHSYNRVPEAMLERVFQAGFYRRCAGGLRDAWRATFADIEQDHPADVLDVWDMDNRQRRGTFPSMAVDRCRFDVRAPFLDRDVVELLRQAPPHWRLQQIAYKRMLITAFSAAADVPWAYTGGRLHGNQVADFLALVARYARRRIQARWPRASWGRSGRENFRDLRTDTRHDARLAQTLRDFAASPAFPDEILDRRGVEEVVQRHWQSGDDLTHLVSMLATFSTAYRLLVWQQPRAIPAEAALTTEPRT